MACGCRARAYINTIRQLLSENSIVAVTMQCALAFFLVEPPPHNEVISEMAFNFHALVEALLWRNGDNKISRGSCTGSTLKCRLTWNLRCNKSCIFIADIAQHYLTRKVLLCGRTSRRGGVKSRLECGVTSIQQVVSSRKITVNFNLEFWWQFRWVNPRITFPFKFAVLRKSL